MSAADETKVDLIAVALDESMGLHAYAFLSAGGTLSFTDWLGLDDEERRAFLAAGRQVAEEQAMLVASALRRLGVTHGQ